MTSTKENPGPFDGLERAEPDEPVFPLRAHDPLAADLVRQWIDRKRQMMVSQFHEGQIDEEKYRLEMIQCAEADEIAMAMDDWREGRSDEPAPVEVEPEKKQEPKYSGHEDTQEEIEARDQYLLIKAASTQLRNAVGEVTFACEKLASYGFQPERAICLAMRSGLNNVASHIEPKRASYHVGEELPQPLSFDDFEIDICGFNVVLREVEIADAELSGSDAEDQG